mgnify:CR=1 FL=1
MTEININVLCERMDGLKNLINEKFDVNEKEHATILEQTKKTNGRVSILEVWQNKIIGGLIISNMVIVPIILWLVYNQLK